ncbi:uncharacterized protein [Acropora muricata]|uniref:uncharacterized protein n=1 Tax=Acropora muricata TaxID=159855 RepID=UPI0034E441BE
MNKVTDSDTAVPSVVLKKIIPRLKRDEIGVTAVPSVHAEAVTKTPVISESAKRRLERATLKNAKRRIQSLTSMETPSSSTCSSEIFTQSETVEQDVTEQEMQSKDEVFSSTPSDNNLDTFVEMHHPNEEQSTATPPVGLLPPPGSECSDCERLAKRNRVLKNQLITAKVKLRSSRLEVKKLKKHAKENRAGNL